MRSALAGTVRSGARRLVHRIPETHFPASSVMIDTLDVFLALLVLLTLPVRPALPVHPGPVLREQNDLIWLQ